MNKNNYTYGFRLDELRSEKMKQTAEKQKVIGSMDYDDWAVILPPEHLRLTTEAISGSGLKIRDAIFNHVVMETNHPCGGFFGPEIVARNYRKILEAHPVYIDPRSSMGGGYMVNFNTFRKVDWNPDFDFSFLNADHQLYDIGNHGIGAMQHFCQENGIPLELGFGGILKKIRNFKEINAGVNDEFYTALEDVLLGIMNWVKRTSEEAFILAGLESDTEIQKNLKEIAEINAHLVENPPRTFREACQLILWVQMTLRMYNGSGSMGRIDLQLLPYYERDIRKGILDDEEAIFHIACILLRDTAYIQLGGYDKDGKDNTNKVSYLVLEAGFRLRLPSNIAVSVADDIDIGLLKRGVEMQLEQKLGYPKFLALSNTSLGFAANGFPIEDGRLRVYSGCHWHAIPGREYSIMDSIKVNLPKVFEIAFYDMTSDESIENNIDNLWTKFSKHLEKYIDVVKRGIDFHHENMHMVFPELVMDLFCYGPIEKGNDASFNSMDYYLFGIDAAGLATAADSFAALYEKVEKDKRIGWQKLEEILRSNWKCEDGELYREVLKNSSRFGSGNTIADDFAKKIADLFTNLVRNKTTPGGLTTLPGIFGWASIFLMGLNLGATPNGRSAGEPISHGANPAPGFRKDSAPTALLKAVANVQPSKGNTAPAQLDIDPMFLKEDDALGIVEALITSHFHDGGTQVNLNVMDTLKILKAYEDPEKYPDLVVRVTGFSAFFLSLSPELRKLIIDRIITEEC